RSAHELLLSSCRVHCTRLISIRQAPVYHSVAPVIDFASILFAYYLGVLQLVVAVGFVYAAFDAYIVIWMRRRITGWVRRLAALLRPAAVSTSSKRKEERG